MLLKRKTRTLCARLSHGCGPSLWAMALAAILASPTQAQFEHISGKWDPPPGGSDWTHPANPEVGVAVHACHLATGQILVWAYDGSYARLWDPNDGSFTDVASDSGLFCAGHAALADGSMLVAGGGQGGQGIWETTIFRSSSSPVPGQPVGPWELVDPMILARWYPTCTTLPDGRILAIAGKNENGIDAEIPEIYNPADPGYKWQVMTNPLAEKLLWTYPFMFVAPHPNPLVHRVFFAGPNRAANDPRTWMLDVGGQSWEETDNNSPFNGRGGSAVMYEPGKVLKAGGSAGNDPDNQAATIDLNDVTPLWFSAGSMQAPRRLHNLVLLADGTVLAVGGEHPVNVPVMLPELYDPETELWFSMEPMIKKRGYHSVALLLADGTVLSAGGDTDNDDAATAEIFSPPYLFWGERPVIGLAATVITYGMPFKVILSNESPVESAEIGKVSLVRLAAVTHGFDQNQRYVPLTFEVIDDHSIEPTAPVNANDAPPGYYMLFLVSNDGVPSVAKYVRLE